MKLIPLILLASSLFGQKAIYSDNSSAMKGMTVGVHSCYFWFHNAVYPGAFNAGWDYEVACYNGTNFSDPTNNRVLIFKKAGEIVDSGYEFSGGSIRFLITPNAADPTKYDFTLTGKGPDDITDYPQIKVTI